jgi:hypothetical protein
MVFLQPSWWVHCTPMFFLVLLELVKRSLWDPLLCGLRLPFGCAILCGLVPACGSAVVRRSSRTLHGFGASLSPSLGRNKPLSRIKHLPSTCSNLSCYETYCCEDWAIPRTFLETNRISTNGNPTLCTSVIAPGRGYHVQSLSQVVQIHTTRE